jgi:hypothetical protein
VIFTIVSPSDPKRQEFGGSDGRRSRGLLT